MKKTVAVALMLSMLLSVMPLSGCKKHDLDDYQTSPDGPQIPDDTSVEELLDAYGTEELDGRVYPVGLLNVPIADSYMRGAVATGSFDFTSDNADGAAFIPVGSVPIGTVVTVPVTYGGAEFSLLAYLMDDNETYYIGFGVSTQHGLRTNEDGFKYSSGFSQVYHNGAQTYLACNECGQVFRQDILAVSGTVALMYDRPYTINTEECFLVTVENTDEDYFSVCPWISTEETGEYSTGVPYVTPDSLVGTKCIMVPQSVIAEGYATFVEWEQQLAEAAANYGLTDGNVVDMPTVDTAPDEDDGLPSLPTVD